MRVTIGGQEFGNTGDGAITVSIFTRSRNEFELESNKLLALNPDEFGEHDVYGSGPTSWVSRAAKDDTVEVTIFTPDGMSEQDIRDHLASA